MTERRRFPPPWTAEETEARVIVRDANGHCSGLCLCEDEPGRRAAAKLLTGDEARGIAVNIAKLPEPTQLVTLLLQPNNTVLDYGRGVHRPLR
jgi:hypothetical protein